MIVRLGYAGENRTLNMSSAKALRQHRNHTEPTKDECYHQFKLNLDGLLKILGWNLTEDVGAFRVGEHFIPKMLSYDYTEFLDKQKYKLMEVGALAEEIGICISFHSSKISWCTEDEKIWDKHKKILCAFSDILDSFHLPTVGVIVVHLGPPFYKMAMGTKRDIIHKRLDELPSSVRDKLYIENDEHWSVITVNAICYNANLPMIYDIDHHRIYYGMHPPEKENIAFTKDGIETCIGMWKISAKDKFKKLHVSSQMKGGQPGHHAQYVTYIDYSMLRRALYEIKESLEKVYIMIEAKACEKALARIDQDISVMTPYWKQLNDAGRNV